MHLFISEKKIACSVKIKSLLFPPLFCVKAGTLFIKKIRKGKPEA